MACIVCSGVCTPPFLFLPHAFYQDTLYTENSLTPPFLEILSNFALQAVIQPAIKQDHIRRLILTATFSDVVVMLLAA